MFSCVSKYWQTNITKREHKFVRVQHLFFRIFPLMFRQSSFMNICIHLQSQTLSDICLYQSCFKRQGRIKVWEYGIRKLKIENIICWVMLPKFAYQTVRLSGRAFLFGFASYSIDLWGPPPRYRSFTVIYTVKLCNHSFLISSWS